MANSLLIEKQTGGYFKFTLNGDTANAITSIQNDLLAVGNQLHFKTGNGANIIKEQFIYPEDITIISGGTFTFTTVAQVWDKLIDIDYFAWLGGGGSIGIDRFDDLVDTFKYTGNAGKTVVVDNSELRLIPITLYNKRLFTELEDTPSSLVPDKMVVVNPAGTALILKDQPEPPEECLNSVGYFDYNDLITQTTPLNAVANVALKLTNDTEGANTSTDQNPYGVSYVWDYTTNQFNFNELEVGDTIDVRLHVQVTTTSANQRVLLSAKFGIGSVVEFTNIIYENQFKTAGLHEVNFVAPFYMGSTDITDYPAELYLTTDASATVKVDGWYVRILRKNINIITVDYTVPDATTTVKGIVRLAGDLAGTANSPTVPELANKVPNTRTVSTTSPLLGGGALSSNLTLSIQQANSVDSGYLSNVDWSTFNGKQTALSGTGFVKISGTTISYDNSTYALDSAVVKLAGAQTVTGLKTFSNMPILSAASSVDGQIVYADANNQLKTITNFKYNDTTGVITTLLGNLGSNAYTSTAYQPLLTNPVTASTSTANYLSKFTGSGYAIGNSLIYDNGTNVGIGTTSPSQKLDVQGNISMIGTSIYKDGATSVMLVGRDADFYGGSSLDGGIYVYGANKLHLSTGNSKRLTIDGSGNVGIGTASPFTVTNQTSLTLDGVNASRLDMFSGGVRRAGFYADSGISNLGSVTAIPLTFSTSDTERMRITSGGNVGIGTTSSTEKLTVEDSTGNSLFRLKHTGSTWSSTMIYGTTVATSGGFDFIGMYANGTAKFNVSSTGVVTASGGFFNSDIRLKDLVDYEYNVESIKPITYVWKDSEDKKRKIGYSAQEVQSILPEAVKEDKEGFLSVDYIQVLVAKIAELENRIKQLEK